LLHGSTDEWDRQKLRCHIHWCVSRTVRSILANPGSGKNVWHKFSSLNASHKIIGCFVKLFH
jgi:hypothetical protein